MNKTEQNLKNVFKSVQMKNKDKLLSSIHRENFVSSIFNSVSLNLFKKYKILVNLWSFNFYKSLNYSRMQLASFVFLFVMLSNLTLPLFINTSQADFVPYLESSNKINIKRLSDSFDSFNSKLFVSDKVSTRDFTEVYLSELSRLRTSEYSNFNLIDFNVTDDLIKYNITMNKGEFWMNVSSNFDQLIDFKVDTPVCDIEFDKGSVFYLKISFNSLVLNNYKSVLSLDCSEYNGTVYEVLPGKSFTINFLNSSNKTFNSFITKNLRLDKNLKISLVDKVLESNNLNSLELNKLIYSLKLNNLIELNDVEYLENKLNLLKVYLKKSLLYAIKDDSSEFDSQLENLKSQILDFRSDVYSSNLSSIDKTNLLSNFLTWINKEIADSKSLIDLEYEILLRTNLLEIVFLYFSDYVDDDLLVSYLDLLSSNKVFLKNRSDNFRFRILRNLYVFKSLEFDSSEDDELFNLKLDKLIDLLTSTGSSSLSFSLLKDDVINSNVSISDIDTDLLLETLIY